MAVNLWRVEEPVTRRLERVERPPVAVRVPVKFAADEIVWPLIRPEVIAVAKRLVVEALVEKKLVVVAEVPVALVKVKAWRVVEPMAVRLVVEAVTIPAKFVKKLVVVA